MLLLAVASAVFNVFLLGIFEFAASNNSSFNSAALQLLIHAESKQGSLFKSASKNLCLAFFTFKES